MTGEITAGTNLKSSPSGCPLNDDWYPIEKSKMGCDKIDSNGVSSTTVIPIEKVDVGELDVDHIDRNDLYDLINTYTKDQQMTEKIYEVKSKSSKHALFVYLPAKINQQGVEPIIIVGTYEDKSTDAYRLLAIPYVIGAIGFIAIYIFLHIVATGM